MIPVKKILLYDPPKEFFDYLQAFVRLLGNFDIQPCSSPMELLAVSNAVEPVLILINQPSSEIAHVLREIQSSGIKANIMVAALEAEIQSLELPAVTMVKKPCTFTALSEQVKLKLGLEKNEGPPKECARLLIADDEAEIIELLADIFRPLGIEVFTAGDGKEALTVFHKQTCNLAIVDLTMPELNGTEVIKRMQSSFHPPKAIFLITAALGNTVHELRRLGYPILPKPMNLDTLEKNILDACEKYGLSLRN